MSNLRSESVNTHPRETPAEASLTASSPAPLILSLDTTTETRSVAVVRGARVIAATGGRVLRENSARVLHDVDEALSACGLKLDDIELFAVAIGPGSFTGLRSGLATVKAFASTLNRPVSGVPTLHAVAYACGPAPRVLACLPAGRGEIFGQLLSVAGEPEGVRALSEPFHLTPAAVCEKAAKWGGDLLWAGAGAHAHAAAIREFAAGKETIRLIEDAGEAALHPESQASWSFALPSESYAVQIAALGLMDYRVGRTTVAEDLQALYVRLSDAELNERCRA
jgi:tRNA threonylcarbamoyladenosine biosynthesis protein TsaB